MVSIGDTLTALATAIGIGLLIGAERERRKGAGPTRGPAGIRTFTLAALLGTLAMLLDGGILLVALIVAMASLLTAAYVKQTHEDPGLTTEFALLLTCLLGALAARQGALAAGLAVCVAIVLAARGQLHHFVSRVLSEDELNNVLILGAAVLVVMPLLPNHPIDPFGALNPRNIWRFAVLMMATGLLGRMIQRMAGPRLGLPLTGLFSGMVSSVATISAMGSHALAHPSQSRPAATGAVLSTVATTCQLTAVIAVIDLPTLAALAWPLGLATLASVAYAGASIVWPAPDEPAAAPQQEVRLEPGGALDVRKAMLLSATMALIMLLSGALAAWFGSRGVLFASAAGGFTDAHSVAATVASMAADGKLGVAAAAVPILAGFSSNTLSKCVAAAISGDRRFARQVLPGLLLVALAAWLGLGVSYWTR
ncbi:MgtC/SapB family protein [Pandoraea sp.]|uniref:MgtC/SapB family protein n=1 Tax=Pandoraea sp. TaxID=1883445 RepID=UPI001201C96A|nr:MgtC/SapB family protein [Pandoraea sp.]TAL55799.1 MAG: MgtC/SapB family protein [Pandoraea sp.]TAM15683.1 MAG: MgtC/SapB family protein [Pandoraea sp.]